MSFTDPQFALAFPLDGSSPHIRATYNDATFDDITIPSATYFLDNATTPESLLDVLSTVSTSQADGTWVWSEPSTGLKGRVNVTKTGGVKVLSQIEFLRPQELSRVDLGFSLTSGTEIVTTGGEDAEGSYQRRYLWLPRRPIARSIEFPMRAVITTSSDFDKSTIGDLDGSWDEWVIEIEFVAAPIIFHTFTTDPEFIVQIPSLLVGDLNAALQQFWSDSSALTDEGELPHVR